MHFRSDLLASLALAVLGIGCRKGLPPPVGRPADAAAADKSVASRSPDLCRGRSRCVITGRAPLAGVSGATLVTVRIAHASPDDEDRCDRREYWLSRPGGDVLIARDCEVQWGADSPGPLTLVVRDDLLDVRYVEYQSSDRCEVFRATVSLSGPKLAVVQNREEGSVKNDACRLGTHPGLVDPPGDGSAAHPLLTPHR